MTTKREAREEGYDNGYIIVEAIFEEAFKEWAGKNDHDDGSFPEHEFEDMRHVVLQQAREAEENARQMSPFEFTAKEFNSSRDPTGVWFAYEDGLDKGMIAAFNEMAKNHLAKVTYYQFGV